MGGEPERRRLFRGAVVVTFLLVGYILVFSESGFLNQRGYQYEIDQLKQELETMRGENATLKRQLDDLHGNRAYIEKLAREVLGMQYPGEQPVRVVSDGDSPGRPR